MSFDTTNITEVLKPHFYQDGLAALMSIHPQYVFKILNETKRYEYRKRIFSAPVQQVFIYATRPVSSIVGFFRPGLIYKGNFDDIWQQTKRYAGISHSALKQYAGIYTLYAIEIKESKALPSPINPRDLFPGFRPPQSFIYL